MNATIRDDAGPDCAAAVAWWLERTQLTEASQDQQLALANAFAAGWTLARAWRRVERSRWEHPARGADGQPGIVTDFAIQSYGAAHIIALFARRGFPPLPAAAWDCLPPDQRP